MVLRYYGVKVLRCYGLAVVQSFELCILYLLYITYQPPFRGVGGLLLQIKTLYLRLNLLQEQCGRSSVNCPVVVSEG